jgi:elongation factor Ts
MAISAADVKKLREMTGAGMMDCKKALGEANGDFEMAVEILRKKGQKVSEKRADRDANQGLIITRVSEDGKKASAIELNCETDFVARNDDFRAQATTFNNLVFDNNFKTLEELLASSFGSGSVSDEVANMVGVIGEKIQIKRSLLLETEGTLVVYNHPGDQLAVIVEFDGAVSNEDIAKDVAMQVAAMKPIAVTEAEVDATVIEKEIEIAKEQLINEGRPAEIAEKAAKGKLRRFFEESVLLNQKFVKDNSLTVKQYLEQNSTPLVKAFYRLQLGEA